MPQKAAKSEDKKPGNRSKYDRYNRLSRRKSLLDNLLIGIGYMFGAHNPEVDEILARSDEDAIRSDWEAVGRYMREGMRRVDKELLAQGKKPPKW